MFVCWNMRTRRDCLCLCACSKDIMHFGGDKKWWHDKNRVVETELRVKWRNICLCWMFEKREIIGCRDFEKMELGDIIR